MNDVKVFFPERATIVEECILPSRFGNNFFLVCSHALVMGEHSFSSIRIRWTMIFM